MGRKFRSLKDTTNHEIRKQERRERDAALHCIALRPIVIKGHLPPRMNHFRLFRIALLPCLLVLGACLARAEDTKALIPAAM